MLLAVDVGNTQTVIGLFDGARLLGNWRIATRKEATSDELGILFRGLFEQAGFDHRKVDGMIVASVVPDLQSTLGQIGRRYFSGPPLFVGPGVKTGMPILYDNPHEVGADRIVNAIAALHRYGAPVIALDFGTATTFDVVSPAGEYLGGVIATGIGVSAEALFGRASRLHPVELRKPERVIGRNVEQSVRSGLFLGYVALVEGMVQRIRAELGAEAPVVATGGLAPLFETELTFLSGVDLDLTLQGLQLVWEKNQQ